MKLHDTRHVLRLGEPLARAKGAVILLHGRGSSGEDIAALSEVFSEIPLAFIAPTANQGTWYPQRFFVPLAQNEPWLTSALEVVDLLVTEVRNSGIAMEQICLAGFSQGACLALEYAARHPRRYGFIAGLSGALIGPLDAPRGASNLEGTPVLLGCAVSDAHIPLPYVEQTATILAGFGATVTKQIFPGASHSVFPDEITWLKEQAKNLSALHPR